MAIDMPVFSSASVVYGDPLSPGVGEAYQTDVRERRQTNKRVVVCRVHYHQLPFFNSKEITITVSKYNICLSSSKNIKTCELQTSKQHFTTQLSKREETVWSTLSCTSTYKAMSCFTVLIVKAMFCSLTLVPSDHYKVVE